MIPYATLSYKPTFTVTMTEDELPVITEVTFRTHDSENKEIIHTLNESYLLIIGKLFLQSLGTVIEPSPGKDKRKILNRIAIRIFAGFSLIPIGIATIITTPIPLGIRCIEHLYRPSMRILHNNLIMGKPLSDFQLTEAKPFHIRTHNLGFVPKSMSIVGDLRDPIERAHEVVQSIIGDVKQPDMIVFQETFNEDATRVLCEGIKSSYPYILHSIAPHPIGFNSGAMFASKYPFKDVKYQRFDHFLGVENICPRGITRVRLQAKHTTLSVYGVHTQALQSKARAESRLNQINQIIKFINEDDSPNEPKILVGDLNTSIITTWGESNIGQPEDTVYNLFQENFNDFFLKDHDANTGLRTSGEPFYLKYDNQRMGVLDLCEPSGSWYHFAEKGYILRAMEAYEQWKYDLPDLIPAHGVTVHPSTWGTKDWFDTQIANTSRLDYIGTPISQKGLVDGIVEIRRVVVPPNAQSASTDHLQVDGRIWLDHHRVN
jgi:hypothetical protein